MGFSHVAYLNLLPIFYTTGITVARELEQQQRRDEIVRQHQARDHYNAERKANRQKNPNKNNDERGL